MRIRGQQGVCKDPVANLQALWRQLPGDQRMGRHGGPGIVVELLVSNAVSNLLLREADIALRMVQRDQGSLIAQRIGQVRLQACQ